MTVSVDEFWHLLEQSGLTSAARLTKIREKIAQRSEIAASTDKISQLLVANGVLTAYQCQLLAQGTAGPFRFGPYRILEPVDRPDAAGWFLVRDLPRARELFLRIVLPGEDAASELARAPLPGTQLETHDGQSFLVAPKTEPEPPPAPPAATPFAPGRGNEEVFRSMEQATHVAAESVLNRKQRKKTPLLFWTIGSVMFAGVLAGGFILYPNIENEPSSDPGHTTATAEQAGNDAPATQSPSTGLWARPATGKPITLPYLPSNVQAIVHVRLAAFVAHPEGDRILRSLGPEFDAMLTGWLDEAKLDRRDIETLTLGLLPQGTMRPEVLLVVTTVDGFDLSTLPSFDQLDGQGSQRIAQLGANAVWFPQDEDGTLIFGKPARISEIRETTDAPQYFRDEFESLRASSDDRDHLTIITNANFLNDEALGLFPASRKLLLDGLNDFWSEHTESVSIHLQLAEVAVAECRMIPRAELQPRTLQGRIQRRLLGLPTRVGNYLGGLRLDSYWQRLALRFPAMVRFVTDQSRVVVEETQVAVNVALPTEAIHNLVLASELTLASSKSSDTLDADTDRSEWQLNDLLSARMDVGIDQQSLEFAIRDVSKQLEEDFPGSPPLLIEIRGADLQEEGITRNQQIRDFRVSGKSVAEVLTALVVEANPTKSNPGELSQKLVWAPADDASRILITTRKGVKNLGLELPAAFHTE